MDKTACFSGAVVCPLLHRCTVHFMCYVQSYLPAGWCSVPVFTVFLSVIIFLLSMLVSCFCILALVIILNKMSWTCLQVSYSGVLLCMV